MHIGKPVITARMMKSKPFMIQAHQVQKRRLQIVNVYGPISNVKAQFISAPQGHPPFHTAAGQP